MGAAPSWQREPSISTAVVVARGGGSLCPLSPGCRPGLLRTKGRPISSSTIFTNSREPQGNPDNVCLRICSLVSGALPCASHADQSAVEPEAVNGHESK